MISLVWLGFIVILLIALSPVVWGLLRQKIVQNDARQSALTLYRAQLDSLDRDREASLIEKGEYETARLEVQRRLLAADGLAALPMTAEAMPRRIMMLGTLALLPVLAFLLYALNGHPSLPAQPMSERQTAPPVNLLSIIGTLEARLQTLSPQDADYERLHLLLGQLDAQAGLTAQAAAHWRTALNAHFTPELALQLAELLTRNAGHVTPEGLALYRQALAAAPADAPWRVAAEARIAAGEHEENDQP